ncbi:hypothetical protein [Citrobacter freundii]|uniref:hypothetical protein n=1 Tax=Citrobacter freundii TaxID=546 RepID=UPI000FDB02AB|nr:hypothetical protein [Citrobacter freundii]RVS10373.1 hypothetical protein EOL15_01785 [Citrobacter freundii]
MTISNALIQKAQNHLNELTRYESKVMTKREFIDTLLAEGYTPECYAVSKIASPTGRQINRWSNEQYREHWMKRARSGTKIEYVLMSAHGFFEVSKTCFDLALTLTEQVEARPHLKTFVVFNVPGQNIPGISSTESKPCVAVYSAAISNDESRVKTILDLDYPGSRVVWYGIARTEQEAINAAGYR